MLAAHPRHSACLPLWLAFVSVLVVACAGPPVSPPDRALLRTQPPADSLLTRVAAAATAAHPGESGALPLTTGPDAFVARLALADAAQSTLDLQYYKWREDIAGQLLLDHLVGAADRGVHIRMLLDDWGNDLADGTLRVLADHPNIEVRLFNPKARGGLATIANLLDIPRLRRRMHNKVFLADSRFAIVGGRNIGDEYFEAATEHDFADFDVMLVGPVVAELAAEFDAYWNSQASVAVADVVQDEPGPGSFLALRGRLIGAREDGRAFAFLDRLALATLGDELRGGQLPWAWGNANALYDPPGKIAVAPGTATVHLGGLLAPVFRSARHEVIVVSPYLVPGRAGVAFLESLEARGVRVRILTNSLASTDAVTVHAAYARHREAMLNAGVEIYETRPTAARARHHHHEVDLHEIAASPMGEVHTKVYGIDRERLFVGSFNLDPRSMQLNTELGVLLEIPVLAQRLGAGFDEAATRHAWRLERIPATATTPARIDWVAMEDGHEIRTPDEPTGGLGREWQRFLLLLLPIEDEL